jgi:hypothetical protein
MKRPLLHPADAQAAPMPSSQQQAPNTPLAPQSSGPSQPNDWYIAAT